MLLVDDWLFVENFEVFFLFMFILYFGKEYMLLLLINNLLLEIMIVDVMMM